MGDTIRSEVRDTSQHTAQTEGRATSRCSCTQASSCGDTKRTLGGVNAKALVDPLGNTIAEAEAKILMETRVKVKGKAVVDALADTPVDVHIATLTKHWAMLTGEERCTLRK